MNFVVFVVDDLGYMDIGANNPNSFYETPNIDYLAKTGTRFTDGYAANPVCSPTRYSLMTGKYPTKVRATNFFSGKRAGKFNPAPLNDFMSPEEITIAEALKKYSYTTFFAGKWHLGPDEKYFPQAQGFDINIGGGHNGGPYAGRKYFAPFKNPQIQEESPEGDHLPDRLARETVKFIKENKDKPFLAYFSFYSVHTPLMGREDLVNKYKIKLKGAEEEPHYKKEIGSDGEVFQIRTQQNHVVYAAMVEAMDEAVGKVLKAIDDNGLRNNTVVVFTSDNGGLASKQEGAPTSNLPLRGGKGWVYEGGIRTPWIIRYPEIGAGKVSGEPICSIDLLPTLLAAAGGKLEHDIDGIDLKEAISGEKLNRKAIYWHYPHYANQGGSPGGAVRMGDYKLLELYDLGQTRLYDLKNDIGERKDLAEEMPDKVKEMQKVLHDWYKKNDALFLQEREGSGKPWSPY